jgi:hypothetical protein
VQIAMSAPSRGMGHLTEAGGEKQLETTSLGKSVVHLLARPGAAHRALTAVLRKWHRRPWMLLRGTRHP